MNKRTDTRVLAVLTVLMAGLAGWMVYTGRSHWTEGVGFVAGAVAVWLVVKESPLNFPIGLLNVGMYAYVFAQSRLFADAGLQVIYFALLIYGWYQWVRGGEDRHGLAISRIPRKQLTIALAITAVLTVLLWQTLRYAGGSASFWDALTASISLSSQWMVARKYVENWIGWIVANLIYVPLYIYKDLHLTAVLYGVFLVMAVIGLREWAATIRQDTAAGGPASEAS